MFQIIKITHTSVTATKAHILEFFKNNKIYHYYAELNEKSVNPVGGQKEEKVQREHFKYRITSHKDQTFKWNYRHFKKNTFKILKLVKILS